MIISNEYLLPRQRSWSWDDIRWNHTYSNIWYRVNTKTNRTWFPEFAGWIHVRVTASISESKLMLVPCQRRPVRMRSDQFLFGRTSDIGLDRFPPSAQRQSAVYGLHVEAPLQMTLQTRCDTCFGSTGVINYFLHAKRNSIRHSFRLFTFHESNHRHTGKMW